MVLKSSVFGGFLAPLPMGNHSRWEWEESTTSCQGVTLAPGTYPKVFLDKVDTLVWFGRRLPLSPTMISHKEKSEHPPSSRSEIRTAWARFSESEKSVLNRHRTLVSSNMMREQNPLYCLHSECRKREIIVFSNFDNHRTLVKSSKIIQNHNFLWNSCILSHLLLE